jgi:hypothetical protein
MDRATLFQLGPLLVAIAAAVSAYFSRQAARAAEKAVQENSLQRLLERWDSPQMLQLRSFVSKTRFSDQAGAKLRLRRILDFLDLLGNYAERKILPFDLIDYHFGYWLWGYYQAWRTEIAERADDWEDFRSIIKWLRETAEYEDFSENELKDFLAEEAELF